ncbi:hypothetical protein PoB_007377200 [Plakobranchus ocellatus]|uniref:Uncharacterized protein n=1 Tax=Plakobranchus ocellatus TaxID=259542 RepID=A0AAV4DSG9_9GAST|nr:hypothetical protein PoB_007377200 [Plakobranchus ocellatus]
MCTSTTSVSIQTRYDFVPSAFKHKGIILRIISPINSFRERSEVNFIFPFVECCFVESRKTVINAFLAKIFRCTELKLTAMQKRKLTEAQVICVSSPTNPVIAQQKRGWSYVHSSNIVFNFRSASSGIF